MQMSRGARKVKPIWTLMKQEADSAGGIICIILVLFFSGLADSWSVPRVKFYISVRNEVNISAVRSSASLHFVFSQLKFRVIVRST